MRGMIKGATAFILVFVLFLAAAACGPVVMEDKIDTSDPAIEAQDLVTTDIQDSVIEETFMVSSGELTPPENKSFYSESDLIVTGIVSDTADLMLEGPGGSRSPVFLFHIKLTDIFRDESGLLQIGDTIRVAQSLNRKGNYSINLVFAKEESDYMVFLHTLEQGTGENAGRLSDLADYWFGNSYYCLFEKIEGYYLAHPYFSTYVAQAIDLLSLYGVRLEDLWNDLLIPLDLDVTADPLIWSIYGKLGLGRDDWSWIREKNPVLLEAHEFEASVRSYMNLYRFRK